MPRTCVICSHPQRNQINRRIAGGDSFRAIASRFGIASHNSVACHTRRCLEMELRAAKQARALDFDAALADLYERACKMLDACEKWLADPEDVEALDISPRDSELTVVYLDWADMQDNGNPTQKKDTLQRLLEKVETGSNLEAVAVLSKAVDNRKLYLDTFKTITDRLDQIARRGGLYQKDAVNQSDPFALMEELTDRLIAKGWAHDVAKSFARKKYDVPELTA